MAQDASSSVSLAHAGFISRAIAFVTDLVVMSVALLLVIALTQAMLGFFTFYGVFGHTSGIASLAHSAASVVIALGGVVIAIGYPIASWVLFGQTLGKALTGIRVVRMDNTRLTIGHALLRYVGYWLSAIPLFLGFLWVLGDPERRAWHDKLAGTCVVYTFQQVPTAPGPLSAALASARKGIVRPERRPSV
jgi:uncharacterized RDD family membrane protein YckC